jgi:hypothetical protein
LSQAALLRNSPLAIINGVPVYPICGAEGEDDKGKKDDDDKSGSNKNGSTGADDDDDDDGDEDDKPPKDPKEYRAWVKNRELSRENARRRAKAKELAEQLKARDEELEAIKSKDMSELQKAQAIAAKAEKTNEELTAKVQGMQVELAFLKMPRDKFDWHDPGAALTLLMAEHRDSLTLGDDGSVDGLDDAVKALAKKHKFLLKPAGGGNGNGSTGGSFSGGDDKNGKNASKAVDRFRM